LDNSFKEQIINGDQIQIKEEAHIEIPIEIIPSHISIPETDIPSSTSIDSSSLTNIISSDHQSIPPPSIIESNSSSRSTSRTSSETKTDIIKVKINHSMKISKEFLYLKIIPTTTTTPKYHVYFSPKNSINNNKFELNKTKLKRKGNDEIKDENENETNQHDIHSSITEQSKNQSLNAPVTRRSINTRSVPNTAAEQEEEKSRRFHFSIQKSFFSTKIFVQILSNAFRKSQ
jgi:hypothetical protein